MRIKVTDTIGDLADDLARIPVKFAAEAPRVVKQHVTEGNKLAQRFAREKSGPHGSAYYKRLTAEMTGALEGEFGPHDGGTPVGGGYRHNGPNADLPRAADLIGPKLAKNVGDLIDKLFW